MTFECLLVAAGTDLTDAVADRARLHVAEDIHGARSGRLRVLGPGDRRGEHRSTPGSTPGRSAPRRSPRRSTAARSSRQSTRLLNDLVDCGGHGLIVGAPGITIDLDGHVVDGLGLDAGILNNGHDDVTIKNGLISQFLYGVQLNPGTARNVVRDLRIEGNEEAGIALADADQGARRQHDPGQLDRRQRARHRAVHRARATP